MLNKKIQNSVLYVKKNYTNFFFLITTIISFFISSVSKKHISKISKHNTIKKFLIKDSVFIETGCYYGETLEKFSNYFSRSISIEPSTYLYNITSKRLNKNKDIKIFHGTSEDYFEKAVIENLNDNITFWLDGHFSDGETFQNSDDSSLKHEIKIIDKYLNKIKKISILIDDADCLTGDKGYPEYNDVKEFFETKDFKCFEENNILIFTRKY